jgi:orotidine-5'-phosphate decarboxylase
MTFTDRLRSVQEDRHSLLCIGLDTDAAKLPATVMSAADPVAAFNTQIIAATHDLVCAYKLNLAFYEAMGERGWHALRETLAAIPREVITIADGKRGDIGNSSELYARSLITELRFGASTVHPYMGFDSIEPFIRHPEHGVFVLALTSNPGAKDFQYLRVNGKPLYERVIARVKKWNVHNNLGLVAGATRPAQLKRIRSLAPGMPLLIPGVGAQGGDLKRAVVYGCDSRGFLGIINAGRSVVYASSGPDFAAAARQAAQTMRDEINRCRVSSV